MDVSQGVSPARPNIPLAIFLMSVIIVMIFFGFRTYFAFRPSSELSSSTIIKPRPQTEVPEALAALHVIDLGSAQPYNMQARALADGATQYVASYDTSNLKAEYERFKNMAQLKEAFILQSDTVQGDNFTLSFGRSVDRLQIFGIANEKGYEGTVVISFYSKL